MIPVRSQIKNALKSLSKNDTSGVKTFSKILRSSILNPIIQSNTTITQLDNLNNVYSIEEFNKLSVSKAVEQLPSGFKRSNILMLYSKDTPLLASDFEKLSSNTINRYDTQKPTIKQVITGRYKLSLDRNGCYYLFFNSFEEAAVFWQNDDKSRLKINGKRTSYRFVDFKDEMRFMYYPSLPDLKILQGHKDTVERNILLGLREAKKRGELSDVLITLGESIWNSTKDQPEMKRLKKLLDKSTIKRSQFVILKNCPFFLKPHNIRKFLWEFNLHESESLNVRSIRYHEDNKTVTYVVVFETPKDAATCVLKIDGEHYLNDDALPLIEAELLDQDLQVIS